MGKSFDTVKHKRQSLITIEILEYISLRRGTDNVMVSLRVMVRCVVVR